LLWGLADLGDRGHVQGVVDPPVAAPGQPVDLPLPEDTSIGAVPLQAAKWSRPGNRVTSRTSPMMVSSPSPAGKPGPLGHTLMDGGEMDGWRGAKLTFFPRGRVTGNGARRGYPFGIYRGSSRGPVARLTARAYAAGLPGQSTRSGFVVPDEGRFWVVGRHSVPV
jgi:hypothetical protein